MRTNLSKGELPEGMWINLWHMPENAKAEDIRDVILKRTGVDIGVDRIAFRNDHCAVISLSKDFVRQLLQWTLSEDTLYGQRIDCLAHPPEWKKQ